MTSLRDYFKKQGRKGGRARARNLTAEALSAIGKKAAQARWGKENTMKMYPSEEGWRIGIKMDKDEHGRFWAMASGFSPGTDPRPGPGHDLGIYEGHTAEEAGAKALESARKRMIPLLPKKKKKKASQ